MTCDTIRQRLLASERPDQPARAEAAHLGDCAACRAWLGRLTRLEQMLPLVPVPPSAPPAGLLAMLRVPGVVKMGGTSRAGQVQRPLVTRPPNLRPSASPRREGARQKLALSLSLAATLALFALGWWALAPTPERPPTFPEIVRGRLKPIRTQPERVLALADLAEELLDNARNRSHDAAAVAEQARNFCQLMEHELVEEAGRVSIGERNTVLMPIARRLGQTGRKASRLAQAWQGKHPAAAGELRQMALAADKADQHLRRLIGA